MIFTTLGFTRRYRSTRIPSSEVVNNAYETEVGCEISFTGSPGLGGVNSLRVATGFRVGSSGPVLIENPQAIIENASNMNPRKNIGLVVDFKDKLTFLKNNPNLQ